MDRGGGSCIWSNRVIARYPAFKEFYGMEEAIEQIVSYLKHASQGLEEQKQILYLLFMKCLACLAL